MVYILLFFFLYSCFIAADFEQDFKEVNDRLTYQKKPIHPGLVEEFCSSWSDSTCMPTTISVDVSAKQCNRFASDMIVEKSGFITYKRAADEGEFSYKWLGKLKNGLHVLDVFDWTGGSATIHDLYFISVSKSEGYTPEGKKYPRLLLSIQRRNRVQHKAVTLKNNKVIVLNSDDRKKTVLTFE